MAAGTVLRRAYVKVEPDLGGFGASLKSGLGKVNADADGKKIGKTFATGFANTLNSHLKQLNLPAIDLKADTAAAMSAIDDVEGKLREMSAQAGNIQVKLQTEQTLRELGGFRKKLGEELTVPEGATGSMQRFRTDGLDRVGEGFDTLDTRAMGFRDTLTGVGDTAAGTGMIMKGNLFEGFLTLGMGIGDLGSAFYNLLIPSLKSSVSWLAKTKVGMIATAVWGKIVAAATKAWAAVQWVLNAAMSANPIGLLIVGLVALGVAVVIAYKKSDTFRAIVQKAWQGIQAAVSYAWNNIIKPAFAALVGFVKDTLIPIVMWLWKNVMLPAWAGIKWAIKAAWVVIEIIFAAIKLYITKVLAPIFTWLWNNIIKPVFSGIASTISFVWNKGIKPIFSALGGFISKHVAPSFRTGVGAIASAWDKVKEAAAKPVRFIVDTVLNKGIIGGINFLASKVGVKDRIPPIRWGGIGGGSKPRGDKLSGNTRMGDGYGQGDGHGVGDGLGSILAGPAKWLSNRLGLGKLIGRFGSNPFVKTLTGAAGKAKDFAMTRIQQLLGELGGGGSVGAGGLRSGIAGVLAALRGQFGSVPLISGLRPGATTLTGHTSYHASGRAIDIAPVRAWAEYIHATYGPRLKELITPWNELNMLNGRPHRYTGAVWNQHNFAGGNAHIHTAMANGGVIGEPVFGIGRSGRTYSFGERGSETVVPHGGRMRLHPDDLAALAESRGATVINLHDARATPAGVAAVLERQALRARLGRSR